MTPALGSGYHSVYERQPSKRWAFYAGLAVWTYLQSLLATLTPGVSVGEAIGIAAPIAIGSVAWGITRWRERYPFRMEFPPVQVDCAPELEFYRREHSTKVLELWVGETTLPVIVNNRFATNITWFLPSFGTLSANPVKRYRQRAWTYANPDVIEITNVRVRPQHGRHALLAEFSGARQANVHFSEPRSWAVDEPLEFDVTVSAKAEWDGWFAFYSRNTQHARRRAVYLRCHVRRRKEPL